MWTLSGSLIANIIGVVVKEGGMEKLFKEVMLKIFFISYKI